MATIQRKTNSITLLEDEWDEAGVQMLTRYRLCTDGLAVRGMDLPMAMIPLMERERPFILMERHPVDRAPSSAEITLHGTYPWVRDALDEMDRIADHWGQEQLANFDKEGLVNKTI